MPFVRAADLAALQDKAAKVEHAREQLTLAEAMLRSYFQTGDMPCPSGCGWRVRLTNAYPMPYEYVQPAPPVGLFVWTPAVGNAGGEA